MGNTALDAAEAGYSTFVICEGTKPVSSETGSEMVKKMKEAGIECMSEAEVCQN